MEILEVVRGLRPMVAIGNSRSEGILVRRATRRSSPKAEFPPIYRQPQRTSMGASRKAR